MRTETPDFDVLIIGAGMCGMYQLHRLLQLGLRVVALEANGDVGGTWYRNRYPGCRFDSESYSYGYSFSPELLAEWDWAERFAPQPEVFRYLSHVADNFGLRDHIQFDTRVTAAEFDDDQLLWRIRSESGREYTTRFLVTAMGVLSAPTNPRIPGIDTFRGTAVHTYSWPADGVDVEGKRVAVIGTGSSGVQVISTIAASVDSLTVFQRNPNWCVPLGNAPISTTEMAEIRANYDDIFARCSASPNGFLHRPLRENTTDVSRETRLALWEELYGSPGVGLWLGNYRDTLTDEVANQELSEFVAAKIRQRVDDPQVAELLVPKDHGFGTKRVVLETGYYEVYNLPQVKLIDAKAQPILEITETGVRYESETGATDIDLDVIVFATGFDSFTGAFDRIDFIGSGGVRLRDKWEIDPAVYLGVQTTDFPNLLICAGPQSGSAAANYPRGIEDIVDWMTSFIEHLTSNGIVRVEPTREAEAGWLDHVKETNSKVLMSKTKSWFTGHNTNVERADHPRQLMYTGGGVRFRRMLAEEAEAGYPNFVLVSDEEVHAA